jgi:hypothetical protein
LRISSQSGPHEAGEENVKIPVWIAMALAMAPAAFATDRYESILGTGIGDDTSSSYVELLHGRLRAHDLQGPTAPDLDWSFVQETVNHSYEVTIMNTPLRFQSAPATGVATFNRCDTAGTILTPGVPLNVYNGAFAARWIVTSSPAGYTYIRVAGFAGLGADSGYEIQMRDTTYNIPRWNNSASQVTLFLIANTKAQSVTGNIYFYSAAGALLATHPLSVPGHGVQTVNTSSIAALAGLSGSAQIAHLGGYGALSGKAVALEPGTGFTFDTALSPVPY